MTLPVLLVLWIASVILLIAVRRRRGVEGSGLLYAYLLNLWTIHWLGAAIYALPWFRIHDPEPVRAGLEQSAYAVIAFTFGSLVLAPAFRGLHLGAAGPSAAREPHVGLATYYMGVGAFAYLLILSPQVRLPSLDAVVSSGQQILVVGLCLHAWQAWRAGRTMRLAGVLAATLSLPFVTIVHSGYLSYGATAALVVFVFVASFFRPRWKVAVAAVLVAYVGMSFYVSYMRDRGEIREVVWGGKPLEERVEQVLDTVTRLELFDPTDPSHLRFIDQRLNQNYLVGLAIIRLESIGEYAYGDTIVQMLMAFIPRAAWPDKPVFAGSGDLVSRYTGLTFGLGTSVGIGSVMEFYVNFGTAGVLVGFMLLGILMTFLDASAHDRLVAGDWEGFALPLLLGVSFLQVGGSLVDIAGTAGGSVAAAVCVNRLHRYVLMRRRALEPRRLGVAPVTRFS